MDYVKMQKQLDMQKWAISEERNEDMCGKMAYCGHCVKEEEFPCAKAFERNEKAMKAAEKAAVKEVAAAAEKTAAKATEQKPAAKKPAAAKKPSAKKTAK